MGNQTIASLTVRLAADASRLNSGLAAGKKSVSGFQKQVNALRGTMLTMFGVGAGISVISGAINVVKDFDAAQGNLAAITGKTRDEISALTDDAKKLGGTTRYTAAEVTSLQTELAKLGFTVPEIRNAQSAILDFAAATGSDLGEAASVAGVAVRAFGLDAADTEDVVATLAVATNATALEFKDYQTILATLGPVARTYGLSLQDTIALTGKLSDAGFDASKAATATRNILLNLADANGALAKSLGKPAQNFPELIAGLIQLREKGVSLNETLELTDKRSVAAFNQFLQTAEGVDDLRTSITGVSKELGVMVDTQMDTLTGQILLLKSAWEGLILSLDDGDGVMSKLVRGSLATFTDALTQLSAFDLMIKRSSKLTRDEVSRTYDILMNFSHNAKGLSLQNIVKQLDDVGTGLLRFDAKYKQSFIDQLRNEGFRKNEAEKLWTEYYARREAALMELGAKESRDWDARLKKIDELEKIDGKTDGKKIESINTIKEEIKKLEDKRDNASISEVGNINTEINALEQKLKMYKDIGSAGVDLPVSFKVDYEFPDIEKPEQSNLFAMDMELPEETFNDMADVMQWYNEQLDIADIKTNLLTSSITAFGDAIMAVTSGSEDAFKSMVTAILSSIRDIITALLAKAIAGVIAGDAVKGGTIGLLSAGAIGIPMLMGLWSKVPSFADGGIVYGDTMARVGEYPGAGSNPEVIAPLSKLESMLGGGSGQWETANVKIGFDQLEIALEKINQRRTSVYGLRG